jgi:hypothetical protein
LALIQAAIQRSGKAGVDFLPFIPDGLGYSNRDDS